jgi:hypothetical protein
MWNTYEDNKLSEMQAPLDAGPARFTVEQFNPDFESKARNKLVKIVLTVQDAKGQIASINDFFNVYHAKDDRAMGFAHHNFKQFLRSVGRLDIYESKVGYGALVGLSGQCEVEIENGFPRIKQYIVPNVSEQNSQQIPQQPQYQQSHQSHPHQAPAPSPGQLADMPDEQMPF